MIDSFHDAAAWALMPGPIRFLGLVEASIRVRGEIAHAKTRKATMTEIAATLCESGQPATVTTREHNGIEWTISVGSRRGIAHR